MHAASRQVTAALIGDSIRLHAEPFVRSCLPRRILLRSPEVNCKASSNVREMIRVWVPKGSADVVHLNCGLHDVRRDPGQDRPRSSIAEYAADLRRIFEYLAGLEASVIWATSTPVSESMDHSISEPRWSGSDLVEYNRVSVELALGFGFRINDLHTCLLEAAAEDLFLPDGVHFKEAGNRLIGRQIATALLREARLSRPDLLAGC